MSYVGDCLDVLRGFAMGPARAQRGDGSNADVWKGLARFEPAWSKRFSKAIKVKAHKTLEEVVRSGGSVKHFLGNFHADRLAKEGAALHPDLSADIQGYRKAKSTVVNVAYHMVDALQALRNDRIGKDKFPRLPSGVASLRSTSSSPHSFVCKGAFWYCKVCYFRTSSPLSQSSRRYCSGFSPSQCFNDDNRGHKLWVSHCQDGEPLLFCSRCWYYGSSFLRNLKHQCPGPPGIKGSSVKFYLVRGQHPVSKLRFSKLVLLHDQGGP